MYIYVFTYKQLYIVIYIYIYLYINSYIFLCIYMYIYTFTFLLFSLSPLECVATLPEKYADTSWMRMPCRWCPGILMAIRGWQTPFDYVGSSPTVFCLLWCVSRRHGALLPPFLLLNPHEDLHHILFHRSAMMWDVVWLNNIVAPAVLSADSLMCGLANMNCSPYANLACFETARVAR